VLVSILASLPKTFPPPAVPEVKLWGTGVVAGANVNVTTLAYLIMIAGIIGAVSDIHRNGITAVLAIGLLAIGPSLTPGAATLALWVGSPMQIVLRKRGLTWGYQVLILGLVIAGLGFILWGPIPQLHKIFDSLGPLHGTLRFLGYIWMLVIQIYIGAHPEMSGTVASTVLAYNLFTTVAYGANLWTGWSGKVAPVVPYDQFLTSITSSNFFFLFDWWTRAAVLIWTSFDEMVEVRWIQWTQFMAYEIITPLLALATSMVLWDKFHLFSWPLVWVVVENTLFSTLALHPPAQGSAQEAFRGFQEILGEFVGPYLKVGPLNFAVFPFIFLLSMVGVLAMGVHTDFLAILFDPRVIIR